MPNKLTTEEFIQRAKEVHGDLYDYSKTEYVNSSKKVLIVCTQHGEFLQFSRSHLQGFGCKKCGALKRSEFHKLNVEFVVSEFKKVHGETYNYDDFVYIRNITKSIINCKIHGPFLQAPQNHKNGQGCPRCYGKNKTTEDVISEFKKIHCEKYNYDEFVYTGANNKGIIKCYIHGQFSQTQSKHFMGQGCPKCAGMNKKTCELVAEFKAVHGDKYNYDDFSYKHNNEKVIIICKTHGPFLQEVYNHKNGHGCPKCAGMNQKTDEIINKFKYVHGETYNYDDFVYSGNVKKGIINCKLHGPFLQSCGNHMAGKGCPKCCGKNKTTEDVISEFKKIHGEKYNYDSFVYTGSEGKGIINCKIHGPFLQRTSSHLLGAECSKCHGFNKTNDEIIKHFEDIHGKKYNYDDFAYTGNDKKCVINCKIHGPFLQTPHSHKNGSGCHQCAQEKNCEISQQELEWLNSIEMNENIKIIRQYKIFINNKYLKVDGYCKETNTVYEFNGDFWHGNPVVFDKNKFNKRTNCTYGELYQKTLDRESLLKESGYRVISIWENDYNVSINSNK